MQCSRQSTYCRVEEEERMMKWKTIASLIYRVFGNLDREDREKIADYLIDIIEEKYTESSAIMFICELLRKALDIPEFDDD